MSGPTYRIAGLLLSAVSTCQPIAVEAHGIYESWVLVIIAGARAEGETTPSAPVINTDLQFFREDECRDAAEKLSQKENGLMNVYCFHAHKLEKN